MEQKDNIENSGFENFENQGNYKSISNDIDIETIRCVHRSKRAMKMAIVVGIFCMFWNYVMIFFNREDFWGKIGFVGMIFATAICFFLSLFYSVVAYIKKRTKLTQEIFIMNLAIVVGIGGIIMFVAWVMVGTLY